MECLLCKEKFIGHENFEKHLQNEKHKKCVQDMQERQNDTSVDSESVASSNSIDNEGFSCKVCNLSFNSLESFQNHSITPEHASKVLLQATITGTSNTVVTKCSAESTSKESILPELNDNMSYASYESCKICAKCFSGPEPYKQHLESKAHKKKIGLLQNEGNILLKCEPCNKSFSGQIPYAQHMVSETHKKKLLKIQTAEKYLSGMTSSNSSTGESKLEEKNDERLWYCKICNIQCSGMFPYEQHLAGSTHFKNEKRMQSQNIFAQMNGCTASAMQISNFNDSKNSENSETRSQLMDGNHLINNTTNQQINSCNDDKLLEKSGNVHDAVNNSYQKDNGNDFLFEEKFKESVVSRDELGNLVKIILPDEKIHFDEPGKSKEEENLAVSNESENDEMHAENNSDGGVKKSEVYQMCELCNVSLYDKESAAEHFESREHFEKKWGKKM